MTLEELTELRRFSAEKVMGWYIVYAEDNRQQNYYSHPGKLYDEFHINVTDWLPDLPSTGQIWLVVEKMRELGWYRFNLLTALDYNTEPPLPYGYEAGFSKGNCWILGYDPNPCIAILKAARGATEGK